MAFPVNGVLDAFTRANETPLSGGGNWGALSSSGQCNLVTNAVQGAVGTNSQSAWVATAFGPGYESYATVTTIPAAGGSLFVAMAITDPGTAGWDGFIFQWLRGGTGTYRLQRVVNGINTAVKPDVIQALAAGDGIGIELKSGFVTGYRRVAGVWSVVVTGPPLYQIPRTLPLLGVGDLIGTPPIALIGFGGFVAPATASWAFDDFGGGTT